MQQRSQELLAGHKFVQYEVSAYATAERQCRHNVNYWEFGDYLGLGAGAHGKVTQRESGFIERTVRKKQPREYLAAVDAAGRVSERRWVSTEEIPFEFMLNTLRLRRGFTRALFVARAGLPFAAIAAPIEAALSRKLLESGDGERFQPTETGMRFLNDLQSLFLP